MKSVFMPDQSEETIYTPTLHSVSFSEGKREGEEEALGDVRNSHHLCQAWPAQTFFVKGDWINSHEGIFDWSSYLRVEAGVEGTYTAH